MTPCSSAIRKCVGGGLRGPAGPMEDDDQRSRYSRLVPARQVEQSVPLVIELERVLARAQFARAGAAARPRSPEPPT